VRVGVQASPRDLESWLELARRLEGEGFAALLCADHPGSGPTPFPALAAAAAVTNDIALGTYVLQCGVREAVHVAADAATLDLLAPGRVSLGLGAGHTPAEWAAVGRSRPSPARRAARLAESLGAVAALLRGETVDLAGEESTLREARLDPAPGSRVEIVVGGGHREVLAAGARLADVVALSGLGRTLADGHRHEARWSPAELARQVALVREAATACGREVALEALVQVVTETSDRRGAAGEIHAHVPSATLEELLATPYVMVGTEAELAEQLARQSEELGIARVVVREDAAAVMARVLARLAR
jgi:probable F420-dependent oxidoreductase